MAYSTTGFTLFAMICLVRLRSVSRRNQQRHGAAESALKWRCKSLLPFLMQWTATNQWSPVAVPRQAFDCESKYLWET